MLENLVDPCEHYIKHGAKEHRNPNNFFDEQGYLDKNPDVAKDFEKEDGSVVTSTSCTMDAMKDGLLMESMMRINM